jgi:hypothetical protein
MLFGFAAYAGVSLQPSFTPGAQTLTVARIGSGTVISSPAGINCGSTCNATFPFGTSVTLTATAAPGSWFTGWDGACTGPGNCTVTMSEAKNVSARFRAALNPSLIPKLLLLLQDDY